jgi:antitoxin StbD
MEHIHANLSVSVTELKKNPTALLREANGETVAILNHNKPAAYLVPAIIYEKMLDLLEDLEMRDLLSERLKEQDKAIPVRLDDL